MKTKLLTLFCGLCLAISLWASNTQVDGIYYDFDDSNNTASVTYRGTSYDAYDNEYSGSVIIPSSVMYSGKNYSVTSIVYAAFAYCTNLTSIIIPNSVSLIGEYAFYGCIGMTTVTIGNPISKDSIGTEIRFNAFASCSSLVSVIIEKTITYIGDGSFYDCSDSLSITIGHSVTSISDGFSKYKIASVTWNAKSCNYCAFGSSIEKFTFGDSVEVIPGRICSGMSKLTSIIIPNSVTSIGSSAFSGCSGLTSVTIPNSVTSIGSNAFNNVNNIIYQGTASGSPWGAKMVNGYVEGDLVYTDVTKTTLVGCFSTTKGNITIPNSVTSISNNAFYGCSGLTSVTIPNSVSSIGNNAFDGCSGLTSVTIPNSVTSIGSSAFSGCSGLTSVTIPNSVSSIGNNAFNNVNNIVYQGTASGSPWGAKMVNGYVEGDLVYTDATKTTLVGCSSAAQGNISIPNSVEEIRNRAFENCRNLSAITIPNSVTTIGGYAFDGCNSLVSVTINSNAIVSKNYDKYYNIHSIFGGGGVQEYIIGDSVTSIGNYAFYYSYSLTAVSIGNSVASIGNHAFDKCDNLTSVTINSNAIMWNTYDEYYNISYIFGNQVREYIIGGSVTSIDDYTFYNCSNLTSVSIGNPVTSISEYAFCNCSGLTSVTFGNSVTTIRRHAFDGCSGLTSITIPNSVTFIESYAFSGCSNITSVSIGNSVTSIGYNAFSGCDKLPIIDNMRYADKYLIGVLVDTCSTYKIKGDTRGIGGGAFAGCENLSSITIPNSVQIIGGGAFEGCEALKTVIIGNGCSIIGDQAFNYCTNLTSVTLGAGLQYVGYGAFAYCSKINDITCYAMEVPTAYDVWDDDHSFYGVSKYAYLFVPSEALRQYQLAPGWSQFDIHPLEAVTTNIDTKDGVIVTPSDNDATFSWVINDEAESYTLEITKDGKIICVLRFNASGQLLGISLAPSKDRANTRSNIAEKTTQGYQFTVTSLSSGSHYNYKMTLTNAKGKEIKTYSGEFTTTGIASALDNILPDASTTKFFRDGQIYIQRNGIIYDARGARIE